MKQEGDPKPGTEQIQALADFRRTALPGRIATQKKFWTWARNCA